MKLVFTLGRVVLGGFFLYNGINHFSQHESLAEYVAAKHVPMPDAAVRVSGVALTLGGASLVLGIKPQLGALAVAGFLAGASPVMHDFWRVQDPEKRQAEWIHFSKNMALLGASFVLMGVEDGNGTTRKRPLIAD